MNTALRLVVLLTVLLAVSPILVRAAEETIPLTQGWKFQPGDNPAYAAPEFDDSAWVPIRVDKIWEDQGYEKLDGYAWYRLKFFLPARLKEKAHLPDGVRICLGKINNFDQSFLNGAIFGINNRTVPATTPLDSGFLKAESSLWDVERVYVLKPDDPRIRWDQENVFAVRVYDEGGQGGLWSGTAHLRMLALRDYLHFGNADQPFTFTPDRIVKHFEAHNTGATRNLTGTLRIRAETPLDGNTLLEKTVPVDLKPGAALPVAIELSQPGQSCVVRYSMTFDGVDDPVTFQEEVPYILTPPAPAAPRIHGPGVYGARTGRPFLFAVSATGERPMTFAAKKLPKGLAMDPKTGLITGKATQRGTYSVVLTARNRHGEDRKTLRLEIGDRIALTPPMGWNSWNCWGLSVDQEKVLSSARVFKEKGLLDHGWSFINVDDGWEIKGDSDLPKRDAEGNILTNEKFPDMKALGDRLHILGLKFGIYSSPGPLTCGGYTASWQHERNDAHSFAAWGVDYLKYDWCSYEKIAKDNSIAELMAPYRVMRAALDEADRDIVYSLCQYGMGKVWEWGASVGGNLWRTTGDITDTWDSMRDIGFSQVDNAAFAGPGHWNDPDMLVVGWVGWGPSLHPSRLTPDEQYTHISLWCLLSAPLLIGCDLTRLDPFTLNLLTNDEVLALDQDPLGRPATPKIRRGDIQVWVKELADGSRAVGVFNLGPKATAFPLILAEAGIAGPAVVRDLWRQADRGKIVDRLELTIPSHGVVLIRCSQ
jgi:alpha-galactosidase